MFANFMNIKICIENLCKFNGFEEVLYDFYKNLYELY